MTEPGPSAELPPERGGPEESSTLPTKRGAQVSLAAVADEGAFRAARPRLVLYDEVLGGVVPLDSYRFGIGRSTRRELGLVLDHDGISSTHARIEFAGRRFFLVDEGSSNHTYLGDEQLAPRSPREITCDARVRFGSIDALFLTDVGSDGEAPPRERYQVALTLLVRRGKLASGERARIALEADAKSLHPAELLIPARLIQPQDWVEAVEQARILDVVSPLLSARRWVLVALVVAAVAALAFALVRLL